MNEDWREGLNDEELLDKWNGLVTYVLKKRYPYIYSWNNSCDDFKQEGLLALWSAIKSYDPSKNVSWPLYAFICVDRQIHRYFDLTYSKFDANNSETIKSIDHNMLKDTNGKGYETSEIYNEVVADEHLYLDDFINSLTPIQKVIYQMSYEGKSQQEIMDMTFVSRQTIFTEKQKIREKFDKYVYKW